MSGDGGGFLSRWSRRKRAEVRAAQEETPEEAPSRDVALPEVEPGAAPADRPARSAESPLAESALAEASPAEAEPTLSAEELAALPPIETIDEATDISGYLRKGVPAALKNAALRRVWAATPAVRDYLDPAREYAYDWNVPGGVPGDGPLGPDFDAKALADRLFTRRQTKVVDQEDASPDTQDARDEMSRKADAAAAPAEPEAGPHPDSADATVDRIDAPVEKSSAVHGVAAGAESAPTEGVVRDDAKLTFGGSELRSRPRRHGGATPV